MVSCTSAVLSLRLDGTFYQCLDAIYGRFGRRSPRVLAVAEVADAGKDHSDAQPVGGRDHFGVPDRAAGLDDGRCAGVGNGLQAVREREEGVRGGDGAGQRKHRLHGAEARGVHPAHLPGADADSLAEAARAAARRRWRST